MNKKKVCLLIGNTRWHWAINENNTWSFTHTFPDYKALKEIENYLWKWAAVGSIPKAIKLAPSRCIKVEQIQLMLEAVLYSYTAIRTSDMTAIEQVCWNQSQLVATT